MAILRTLEDEARPRTTTTPTVAGASSGITPAGGSETPTQPRPGFQAPPPIQTPPNYPNTPDTGTPPPPPPNTPTTPTYNTSQLEGFDTGKLNDPAHTTLKYTFARLASKYPPTAEGLRQLVADPEFAALGIQSLGNGNFKLPDGSIVDAIRGFQEGGYAWQWGVTGTGTTDGTGTQGTGTQSAGGWSYDPATGQWSYLPGTGTNATGTYSIPGIGGIGTTDEFTDPTTSNYEDLLNARIQELLQPLNDSARQQYADLLQQNIDQLSQGDQGVTDLIASLQRLAATAGTPTQYDQMVQTLGPRYMALDPRYQQAANTRIEQLQAEPYTGAEWEAYRTAALDPIEADRTAALQRALAQVSDRGMDPTSGIAQALQSEVNRGYDANRAKAQNDLALSRVATRAQRQGEAFDVETALANLLQDRQLTGLDILQNQSADQLERYGLSAQSYGALADILPQRTAQQLSAAQTLSNLSGSVRSEEEARRATAIALQGILAELPERRLQLALATLGQGEAPDSMVNSLLQLAGLGNQAQYNQNQQTSNNWQGLSTLLGFLTQQEST